MISRSEFEVLRNIFLKVGLADLLSKDLGYRDILDALKLLEQKGYITFKTVEDDIEVTDDGNRAMWSFYRKERHCLGTGFIESKKDKWKAPMSVDEVYIP